VILVFFKRFIAQKIQRDTQLYKIVPLTNRHSCHSQKRVIEYLPC